MGSGEKRKRMRAFIAALSVALVVLASADTDVVELAGVNDVTVKVKTAAGADSATSKNPQVKVCGTTTSCAGSCETACSPWANLATQGLAASSEATVKIDAGSVQVVNKICFQMAAGDIDAWTWKEASVEGAQTWKFSPTGSGADVLASASQRAEVCKENVAPSPPPPSRLGAAGDNEVNVKFKTDSCASCGTQDTPYVQLCGTYGGCTTGCDTKCTPFTQVPGTDGAIAKDAESTAVVGLGDIEKVTKMCMKIGQSGNDDWQWKTAVVGTGGTAVTFTATSTDGNILGSATQGQPVCANAPPPPPATGIGA